MPTKLSIFFFLISGSTSLHATIPSVPLVIDGKIQCAIVLPERATELQLIAAQDFQDVLHRATGNQLIILKEGDPIADNFPIIVGPSNLSDSMGYDGSNLEPEQFRIIVREDAIILLAKDIPNKSRPETQSMVTAWAFAYLMDHYMGVIRLWPGELGTVVPELQNLDIPYLDVTEQPKLIYRSLRNADDPEINLWNAFYQSAGSREMRPTMHSFREGKSNGDWWGRFHKDKPSMLARGPDGKPGHPKGRPHFSKICVSNPEVTDEVIRLWQAAGAPDFWDLTPNDGNCFCTCDGCRELDRIYGGVEYTKDEIWNRPPHVSLTERYVWFWNQVITRMREINPTAKIGVYFYSTYRIPPKNQRLKPGIYGAMVPTLDTDNWDGWIEAGATEIGLRPNWWYVGACGPSLHLQKMGRYVEHARDSGMVLLNMDSLYGYWATQGIKYYLVSRLAQRWDLDTNDVIKEYCEAFGTASEDIRRYFEFWKNYDNQVAYNIPAGGMTSVDPNGIYETYCREKYGSALHPLTGHWKTLSAIYNPKVMHQARSILDSAQGRATDRLTHERIAFLEAGLDYVELCGKLVDATREDKPALVKQLIQFNQSMTERFGYWGTRELYVLNHWGLLDKEINVDGM